jgi:hypothetical protein
VIDGGWWTDPNPNPVAGHIYLKCTYLADFDVCSPTSSARTPPSPPSTSPTSLPRSETEKLTDLASFGGLTRFPFCFPGWMIGLQVGTALPRGLPSRSSTCTTPYFGCVVDTVEMAASIPSRRLAPWPCRLHAMCSQPLASTLPQPLENTPCLPQFQRIMRLQPPLASR